MNALYAQVKMKPLSCSPLTNPLASASTAALEVFETDCGPLSFLSRASDGRVFWRRDRHKSVPSGFPFRGLDA